MEFTRLTEDVSRLWERRFHELLLALFGIQDYDIRCRFRLAVAAGEPRHLVVDGPTGTLGVADRDTIIERHKERVGIPVKRRMWSAMFVKRMTR